VLLLKIQVFAGCYTVSLDELTPVFQGIILSSSSGSSGPYISSVWGFITFPVMAASAKMYASDSPWSVSQYVVERFFQMLT
jgi:hypothetical protein